MVILDSHYDDLMYDPCLTIELYGATITRVERALVVEGLNRTRYSILKCFEREIGEHHLTLSQGSMYNLPQEGIDDIFLEKAYQEIIDQKTYLLPIIEAGKRFELPESRYQVPGEEDLPSMM